MQMQKTRRLSGEKVYLIAYFKTFTHILHRFDALGYVVLLFKNHHKCSLLASKIYCIYFRQRSHKTQRQPRIFIVFTLDNNQTEPNDDNGYLGTVLLL